MNIHVLEWFDQGVVTVLSHLFRWPVAFQLWFVRDMLVFVCLLPLIWPLLRIQAQSKWLSITSIVLLFAALSYWNVPVLWMAIGGMIALGNVIDLAILRNNRWGAFVSALVFGTLVLSHVMGWMLPICDKLIPPTGIVFLWCVYDVTSKGKLYCQSGRGKVLTGYTFFIYLTHIPLMLILKKIPLLLDRSESMMICCFLLIPWLYVAMAIWVGQGLKKKIPFLYNLYTGGR